MRQTACSKPEQAVLILCDSFSFLTLVFKQPLKRFPGFFFSDLLDQIHIAGIAVGSHLFERDETE